MHACTRVYVDIFVHAYMCVSILGCVSLCLSTCVCVCACIHNSVRLCVVNSVCVCVSYSPVSAVEGWFRTAGRVLQSGQSGAPPN